MKTQEQKRKYQLNYITPEQLEKTEKYFKHQAQMIARIKKCMNLKRI